MTTTTHPRVLSFRVYQCPVVNGGAALDGMRMSAIFQQHRTRYGCPAVIRVNPKLVAAAQTWLTGSGNQAEVRANGGTLIGEVEVAAA